MNMLIFKKLIFRLNAEFRVRLNLSVLVGVNEIFNSNLLSAFRASISW